MNTSTAIQNRHPLIQTLYELKGNPKALLFIEPLWGVPYNLIAPFATLYMQMQGITDLQIGLMLSIGLFLQIFFAFFAGIFSDRLGRKYVSMFGDSIGWALPCAIWAISDSFPLFLIAISFNGLRRLNQTAWACLLIEDAKPDLVMNIFSWVHIAGLLSVFFAPISGILIDKYSLVPVMKVLYSIFAVCMTIKFIVTYKFTSETSIGKERRKATKNIKISQSILEYKHVVPMILKNKNTLVTLFVMICTVCSEMVTNTFFSLYVTSNLGISEKILAFLPFIRAIVMLIFFFGVQKILDRLSFKMPMIIGMVIYIFCQILLLNCPFGNVFLLAIHVFLDSIAFALVIPRKDAMATKYTEPNERARILSLLITISLIISTPFGYISGVLSDMNRAYPFYLSIAFYLTTILLLIFVMKEEQEL